MKIWKRITAFFLTAVLLMGTGCQSENSTVDAPYKIFYVNTQGTALEERAYQGNVNKVKDTIKDMLEALKTQEGIELQPAIPDNVKLENYRLEDGKLELFFSQEYRQMDVVREVLCRAAVVRTLTQITGVNQVMFYVDNSPLTNREGSPYGYMQASDFVQNTGSSINFYEETSFELYFSKKTGDKLILENVTVQSNSSQSKESAAIECLIKGPKSEDALATIPKGTKLLNVSIKEGVCYLNFNEGLKNSISGVTPEVVIYSIVNTVVDCGNVGLVQIAINGESNLMFQESIKLGEPLKRNLDIVEGK